MNHHKFSGITRAFSFILFIVITITHLSAHEADPNPELANFALFATDTIIFGNSALDTLKMPDGPIGTNNTLHMKNIPYNANYMYFYDDIFVGNSLIYPDADTSWLKLVTGPQDTCYLDISGSYSPIGRSYSNFTLDHSTTIPRPITNSNDWYLQWPEDSIPTNTINRTGGTILPGTYGTITVTGITYFQAGIYNIGSLILNPDAQLIINKSENEICRILVKNELSFGTNGENGVIIRSSNGNSDLGKILIYTTDTEISTNPAAQVPYAAEINASIVAPRGKINFLDLPTIRGQVLARTVYFQGDFDATAGEFVPFNPSKISLVGASTFSITENPNTRFVNIPVELGGTMDSASSVDFLITEYHDPTNKAIGSGVDFNANIGIANSTGTINFSSGATLPNAGDSLWIQIIDDNLTSSDINESDTEYVILKLFNPVVALLEADASAYEIDSTGTIIDTLTYRIPIINDDFNSAPIVSSDTTITVAEGSSLTFTINNNDPDLPSDTTILNILGTASTGSATTNTIKDSVIYSHNGAEVFTDIFQVIVTDKAGASDTITVNIIITPTNDNSPISIVDSIHVNEGATATTLVSGSNNLLANDNDIDGMNFGPVVAIKVSDPTHGTVTVNSNGTFSYTHNGSENFTDSFTYKTNDGIQDGNIATVYITINSLNDNQPITNSDSIHLDEGATTTTLVNGNSSVLDNDTDVDGMNGVSAILVTDVSNGTLTLNPNGTFIYSHSGSEIFTDSFTYKTNDGIQDGNTATVNITINPLNDNPAVSVNDSINVNEGATASILIDGNTSVLDNDNDPDGMSGVIAILVSSPTHGSINLLSNGTFSFTHNGSENFIDSFTYKTNDGNQDGNTATVYITVNPINDNKPVTVSDSIHVNEGATATTLVSGSNNLLANDSDIDGMNFGPVVAIKVSDPTHGTITINSNGTFSYTHNGSENFTDSFTYKTNDGVQDGNTVTVNIIINPLNDNQPITNSDSIHLDEGATTTTLVNGNSSVLDNDTDVDGMNGVSAILVTDVSNGTLTLNPNGTFVYTHNGSEIFTDSFTYKTNDGIQDGNTATVNITINPLNDNPAVSVNDSINVNEGATASILIGGNTSVLDNDSDPDGMSGVIAILVSSPTHGSINLLSDGTFSYTHNGSENFNDSFTYKTNDGIQDGNTATVYITVNPINDNKPVTVSDSIHVNEGATATTLVSGSNNLLANDSDIDGMNFGPVVAIKVSDPTYGTVTVNSNGTFSYTHNGSENFTDSFTYKTNDGVQDGNTVTVNITINPLNDNSPIANNDSIHLDEGATATALVSGNSSVLDNDSDADGMNGVSTILVTDVSNGTLTLNPNGTFIYTHNGSEIFTDSFTYKTNDGIQDGNTATVNITINPINDNKPVSIKDSINLNEGATATTLVGGNTSVLDNDSDPDGMSGVIAIVVSNPSHGNLILNSNGTFSYQHNDSENFTDSFEYKTNDGIQDGDTVSVNITINPINDNTPFAQVDVIQVAAVGGTSTVLGNGNSSVLDNDNDVDLPNDSLFVKLVGNVSYGTFTLNGDGTFSYTHDGSGNLQDTAKYVTVDTAATAHESDTTLILIGITLTFSFKPEAINDSIIVNEGDVATTLSNGESSLLWNDDPNDPLDDLQAYLLSPPINGTVTINPGGTFSYTHNGTETTTDQFTYYINDLGNLKDTATVYIIVTPINDNTPVSVIDTIIVDEGNTATTLSNAATNLLTNDSDIDPGDVLSASLAVQAINGTATVNANGTFSYTHNDEEVFTDQFTYTVTDAVGHSTNQIVIVIINPVNDNDPSIISKTITVLEGDTANTTSSGSSTLLVNITDIDIGDTFSLDSITTNGSHGIFQIIDNSTGTFTYIHDDSENFTDTVIYKISDAAGHEVKDTLIITITPVNDNSPTGNPDSIVVVEGGSTTLLYDSITTSVLANDSDIDIGYSLSASLLDTSGSTSNGNIVLFPDGTFQYFHNNSETTLDSFSYIVSDGLFFDTVSVIITIIPFNDNTPTSLVDTIIVDEGGTSTTLTNLSNNLLFNDIDIDPGDTLSASLHTQAINGTATVISNGTFSYTHNDEEIYTDQFTYTVTDAAGHSTNQIVIVIINPVNDNTPIIASETLTGIEGDTTTTTTSGASTLLVTIVDTDPNDSFTLDTIIGNPNHGIFKIVDKATGSFIYIHDDSENFLDTVIYVISDAAGHSVLDTLLINIIPVNDNSPIGINDSLLVFEGGNTTVLFDSITYTLLANDTDIDLGYSLTASLLDTTGNTKFGNVVIFPDGSFQYFHDNSENMIDSFSYIVSDGLFYDTALVKVSVISINDNTPVSTIDTVIVSEGNSSSILKSGSNNLLKNDYDIDLNDTLYASLLDSANHGNITINSNGTFIYTHFGEEIFEDQFTYTVTDANNHSTAQLVVVIINPVNDNDPIVVGDSININEGDTITTTATGDSSLLTKITDLDKGDSFTIDSIIKIPDHGTFIITDSSAGTFILIHDDTENFNDTVIYVISDKAGNKVLDTLIITIDPINDNKPQGEVDSIVVIEGGVTTVLSDSLTYTVISNDKDIDINTILSVKLVDTTGVTSNGSITLNPDGTFEYIHDNSENFIDSFKYIVSDGLFNDTVLVHITITPINDNSPVAIGDTISLIEGQTVSVLSNGELSVINNDSDIDGMNGVTAILSDSTKLGALTFNSNGTFSYTHKILTNYKDNFTYYLFDGVQHSQKVTVLINIEEIPKTINNKIASYYDNDANGYIDSLFFEFYEKINFLDQNVGKVTGNDTITRFSLMWSDENREYPVSIDLITIDSSEIRMSIDVTNLFSTTFRTSGELQLIGKFILRDPLTNKYVEKSKPYKVYDFAAPVLTRAEYLLNIEDSDSTLFDALQMNFSEEIKAFTNDTPFVFIQNSLNKYYMDLNAVSWYTNKKSVVFKVNKILNAEYASKTDSAWIFVKPDFDTLINSTSFITDQFSNKQVNSINRKVPLIIKENPYTFTIQTLHLTGKHKPKIPEVLKVGDFSEGAVMILLPSQNGSTQSIPFDVLQGLLDTGNVQASVYDLVGNEVASSDNKSYNKHLTMGVKVINNRPALILNWDGKNTNSRSVSTGAYVIILNISSNDEKLLGNHKANWNIKKYE